MQIVFKNVTLSLVEIWCVGFCVKYIINILINLPTAIFTFKDAN